jgi:starch synthase
MQIAFAASEMTPFAKTGGLADVAGALPLVLAGLGHRVTAFIPKYRVIVNERHHLIRRPEEIRVAMGDRTQTARLWEGQRGGVRTILLDHEGFYGRQGLYQEDGEDFPDNAERFIFFSRGILEALRVLNWEPHVIHCHDWQTSLIPVYLKTVYAKEPFFADIASVLTIHNLAVQGLFAAEVFAVTGRPDERFTAAVMEYWGKVNFLKAGLVCADVLTTVSRKYSHEIQTPDFGCGLDGVVRQRSADLYPVLNGVDYQDWDPRTDPYLVATYSSKDLTGKEACRRDLQEVMGLPVREDVPLLGTISRLTSQKGIDLITEIADDLLNLDLQMVVLGTGEVEMERTFQSLQHKYPDKLAARIGFDVALSHKIEAGADILLMPSRYEPCGLNQMYSLAYGTIPVVRATGGLDDTITPFNPFVGIGNGFKFQEINSVELLRTIRRAIAFFRQREVWNRLVQNAMAANFSWERPAREYERIYWKALAHRRRSEKVGHLQFPSFAGFSGNSSKFDPGHA